MRTLPSGLPEQVADDENLTRFLSHSNQFNSLMAKPAAFLPHPTYKNASVFRIGNEPNHLRQTWKETTTGDCRLKAAAICKARYVREIGLEVIAAEPPPKHANIEGWPWIENDPELQKAKQKELASQIAAIAEIVRL